MLDVLVFCLGLGLINGLGLGLYFKTLTVKFLIVSTLMGPFALVLVSLLELPKIKSVSYIQRREIKKSFNKVG